MGFFCQCTATRVIQEEDPEKYQAHFASYVAEEIEGDDLEDLYKSVRSMMACSADAVCAE